MKTQRVLKVAELSVQAKSTRKIKFFPKINLGGKWLASAGFAIGESVRIIVADNMIQIIKHQTDQLKKEVANV